MSRVESFEALNAHLEQRCLERMDATLRGHAETIGQRMERDLDALLPLPAVPYDACDKQPSRVFIVPGTLPHQRLLLGAGGLRTPGLHGSWYYVDSLDVRGLEDIYLMINGSVPSIGVKARHPF